MSYTILGWFLHSVIFASSRKIRVRIKQDGYCQANQYLYSHTLIAYDDTVLISIVIDIFYYRCPTSEKK